MCHSFLPLPSPLLPKQKHVTIPSLFHPHVSCPEGGCSHTHTQWWVDGQTDHPENLENYCGSLPDNTKGRAENTTKLKTSLPPTNWFALLLLSPSGGKLKIRNKKKSLTFARSNDVWVCASRVLCFLKYFFSECVCAHPFRRNCIKREAEGLLKGVCVCININIFVA